MVLRRKIYDELLNWKKTRKEECVLIAGPRQVGKSFIVEHFGKNEYDNYIEINFVKSPNLKSIFAFDNADYEISSDEIIKRISAYIPNAKFEEGKTLLFLDEIQKCGEAITALKFLAKDKRFDTIASGSLLGLAYGQDDDSDVKRPDSYPVGYLFKIDMHSLDFEEYLWANGYGNDAIAYLKDSYLKKEKVPEFINNKYEELFREFIVVGGMPEVVISFIENKNYNEVQRIQKKIMDDYYADIAIHAKGQEKIKVRKCYDSIPRQLAKETKKFQYSTVEKGKTSRAYENSIQWLEDSGLVNVCYNVFDPYIPLIGNENVDQFKLYYHDTGLLCSVYGLETKLAVLNNSISGNIKGGIYENVISELLVKKGLKIHYYKKNDSTMEIEFLIEKSGGVIPVEVKAGNDQTPSLNHYMKNFKPEYSLKFINGNVGVVDNKITIPHYMIMFI